MRQKFILNIGIPHNFEGTDKNNYSEVEGSKYRFYFCIPFFNRKCRDHLTVFKFLNSYLKTERCECFIFCYFIVLHDNHWGRQFCQKKLPIFNGKFTLRRDLIKNTQRICKGINFTISLYWRYN